MEGVVVGLEALDGVHFFEWRLVCERDGDAAEKIVGGEDVFGVPEGFAAVGGLGETVEGSDLGEGAALVFSQWDAGEEGFEIVPDAEVVAVVDDGRGVVAVQAFDHAQAETQGVVGFDGAGDIAVDDADGTHADAVVFCVLY